MQILKLGQFPIRALGRARASMDIQGVIKIISDAESDEVLGVHMIAPRAADLNNGSCSSNGV